ncbi:MAG: class I SAM-dependent methyltransferase [Planctomycetaceae bacterium]|nr:MAG: class I SAM-dependent methyltransferase [Planctomycetaceae bacterium]
MTDRFCRFSLTALVFVTLCWVVQGAAIAQRQDSAGEDAIPPALTHYMGREIAQTMHYRGAPWLTRDNREEQERCSLLLTNLGLKRGMTVCDMGCGNGYYTLKLAQMVGPEGRVLAVDIQPQMLAMLKERAERAGLDNIELILGQVHDPKLPPGEVDLVLMVDVYHEFSHPEHMLAAIRESLSPDGVVALTEYRAEDPNVPIRPLHKMSKRQIMKEFTPNGFKLVREFDRLPWQHMMFFQREDPAQE